MPFDDDFGSSRPRVAGNAKRASLGRWNAPTTRLVAARPSV